MSFLNELKPLAQNFNILYVEDEQLIREKLDSYLRKIFNNSYTAQDGIEALELFNKHDIDLVISDVFMPRMDGLELSKKIKEKNSKVPIILITASTDTYCLIDAIDIGINKFLLKPTNKEKLFLALMDTLNILKTKKDKQKLEELSSSLSNQLENKTKELNLFKDDMIAIFTHELKTPIHAIINYSDYIANNLDTSLNEKKQKKLQELSNKIYSNAMYQSSIIETLLDVSKYKAGKMILKEIEIEAKDLISSVISRYSSLYEKQISKDLEDFKILWDKKAFLMIFENIYSNALKYSKSKIHITLKKSNEDQFLLSIEDDGEGIKEDMIDIVFNQFEQLEESYIDRKKPGTGLGLYLVKLILDTCNAKIDVTKSDLLQGAKFSIKGSIKND